jgi:hypothetical protein
MGSLDDIPLAAGASDGDCDPGTTLWAQPPAFRNSRVSKEFEDIFYDLENPPLPTSSGEPQAESNYTDGSGALFSMYLDRAEEEDKKAAERWKGDADGILVFVRRTCCS